MNSSRQVIESTNRFPPASPSMYSSKVASPCNLSVSPAFVREEQQLFEQLFHRFATLAARRLSAHLNTDVLTTLTGFEAVSVEDLNEVNPFQFIDLQEAEPPALLQFDLDLATLFVEASLGGKPTGDPIETRPLTALEMRVLGPYFALLTGELEATWPVRREPATPVITTEKKKIASVFANYSLHAVCFEVTLFDVTASLRVVIPMHMLRGICQLSDALGQTTPAVGNQHQNAIKEALASSNVALAVEIEVFRVALADMASLQPNDVLVGNIPLDAPLTVKLNGTTKYEANALQLDGERAIQLRRAVTHSDNAH